MNYPRCPYDIQEKYVPMFKKNGSTNGIQPASTTTIIILIIFDSHGTLRSSFLTSLELVVLVFQQIQSLHMTPS